MVIHLEVVEIFFKVLDIPVGLLALLAPDEGGFLARSGS